MFLSKFLDSSSSQLIFLPGIKLLDRTFENKYICRSSIKRCERGWGSMCRFLFELGSLFDGFLVLGFLDEGGFLEKGREISFHFDTILESKWKQTGFAHKSNENEEIWRKELPRIQSWRAGVWERVRESSRELRLKKWRWGSVKVKPWGPWPRSIQSDL